MKYIQSKTLSDPKVNAPFQPQYTSHTSAPTSDNMLRNQPMLQLQKSLGNQAIAQMMKSKNNSVVSSLPSKDHKVIQRVSDNKDHFQNFVEECKKKIKVTINENEFLLVKACAYILDHHSYKKIHNNLPENYKQVENRIPTDGQPQSYLNIIQNFAEKSNITKSTIEWGPLTKDGVGTSVKAIFFDKEHVKGSATGTRPPWMDELALRKDGTKTLYAMGHLLNADLGGPGLDYNYVPLPARAGWYGANDANAIHSNSIEQIAKSKYRLLNNGVKNLEYSVQAVYGRKKREEISQMESALDEMNDIKINENKVLRSFDPENKEKLKENILSINNLQMMLYAVSSGNYFSKNWATLKTAVSKNIELWKLEDKLVPKTLITHLEWEQNGTKQTLDRTIHVQLPNSISAPYDSNKKSKTYKSTTKAHGDQVYKYLSKNVKDIKSEEAKKPKYAASLMDLHGYERIELVILIKQALEFYKHKSNLENNVEGKQSESEKKTKELEDVFTILDSYSLRFGQSEEDFEILADLLEIQEDEQSSSEEDEQSLSEEDEKPLNYMKLMATVNTYIKQKNPEKLLSEISFNGNVPWPKQEAISGNYTMTAKLQKDGHPEGSDAGGDPEWMLKLEERANANKTIYVRGHLLNRKLGGSGLDHNMVPLTAGGYGSNDANDNHSKEIEEQAKKLYIAMGNEEGRGRGRVTDLVYTVRAVFGNHQRPFTKKVEEATKYYTDNILNVIQNDVLSENNKSDDEYKKTKFYNMYSIPEDIDQEEIIPKLYNINKSKYGENRDPNEDVELKKKIIKEFNLEDLEENPGNFELIKEIWEENIIPSEYEHQKANIGEVLTNYDLKAPIASLPMKYQETIQQVLKGNADLNHLFKAVCDNNSVENYVLEDIKTLGRKLNNNLTLWKLEDIWFPLKLIVDLNYKEDNSPKLVSPKEVKITLPTQLDAPYRERS